MMHNVFVKGNKKFLKNYNIRASLLILIITDNHINSTGKYVSNKRFSARVLLIPVAVMAGMLLLTSCGKKATRNNMELLTLAYDEAKAGHWDKALIQSKSAVEQNSNDVTALIMYALCLENMDKPDEAQQVLQHAVQIDPGNFRAQYNLGRILFQHGRYQDCVSYLRAAEKLNPDNVNVIVLLAQVDGKLKLESAINYYAKLTKIPRFSESPVPWNQMGIIYAENNKKLNALKCFLQAYKTSSDNPKVILNFAVFLDYYLDSKDGRKKAMQFYRKYLSMIKNNPELQARSAEISRRLKTLATSTP